MESLSESDPHSQEAYNREILIRSIALTRGKILQRRGEIRKNLVISALDLIDLDTEFKINDLERTIETISGLKITPEEIISIIDYLTEEHIVEHVDGSSYFLKRKSELPKFEELSQPVWEEFSSILVQKSTIYDPHIHKNARTIFDAILMKILTRYAISQPLDNQIDNIPIENIKNFIQKEISKIPMPGNFSKKFFDVLVEFFTSENKALLDCIFMCYSWFIDLNVIKKEKSIQTINFSDEVQFLLIDTNFIVPLICSTDPRHPLSTAVISFCNKNKIKLYYATITKDQVWDLISASKSLMKLDSGYKILYNNQFVDDYRNLNRTKFLHWSEYIIFLNQWETFIKNQYNLEMLPNDLSKKIDNEDFELAKTTLPMLYDVLTQERERRDVDYVIKKRPEISFIHDAYCVGLISYLKKQSSLSANKRKMGPWFLTYDRLLLNLNNRKFRKLDDIGFIMQPRILLNYFLAYSKFDYNEEDMTNIAIALLRYTARPGYSKLTVKEYSQEFAVKIGGVEEDSEMLLELLKKSPLINELERALNSGSISEADRISGEIIAHPNLEKVVSELTKVREKEESLTKRNQELIEIIKKQSAELDKERSIRETLEKTNQKPIQLTNVVKVSVSVEVQDKELKKEINNLIEKLNDAQIYKSDEIPQPPQKITESNLRPWLETLKMIIETTKLIKDGMILFLPLIMQILNKIS
jgi:predicted nucleic acid-binding protein